MANYGVTGGTGAPRYQEASGEWKSINICLKYTAALQATGIDQGYLPKGTLVVTDTDNTDGCYNVLDTAVGTQNLRQTLILSQNVSLLHLGDQNVEAIIEGIWTSGRFSYNGPALSNAQEDLFRQRLIQRWDGV